MTDKRSLFMRHGLSPAGIDLKGNFHGGNVEQAAGYVKSGSMDATGQLAWPERWSVCYPAPLPALPLGFRASGAESRGE